MKPVFTQSALSTAYRCNRLFQYLYVDKLESQAPKSADMLFGTAIHLGLETMLTGEGDYIADFKLFWDIQKTKGNRYGRHSHEDLETQGCILLDRFKRLHAKKVKIHQMEKTLKGSLGEVLLEGTPDIIGWFNDVPSVIDFKTSGYKYPKEKPMFAEQMYLYAHLSQLAGFPVQQLVYLVFTKGKEPSIQTLTHTFTQTQLDAAISNVELQCNDLMKKRLFSQNRANCIQGENKCDFFQNCHG